MIPSSYFVNSCLPNSHSIQKIKNDAVELCQKFLVLQDIIDHHQPLEQKTLRSQRRLPSTMTKTTNDFNHDRIRNLAGGIEASYQRSKTALPKTIWEGDDIDELVQLLLSKPFFIGFLADLVHDI